MSRPYEYLDKVASLGSLWRVVCLCGACVLLVVVAIWGTLSRCAQFVQRWRAYMAYYNIASDRQVLWLIAADCV